MGGERSRVEVGTFPRTGKRIIFSASGIWQVDERQLEPVGFEQWLADAEQAEDDGG